ncbi:MAG: hypothetical protein ABI910_14885 [Gemmatimonadota bacterium]
MRRLLAVVGVMLPLASGCGRDATLDAPTIGQWIWTSRDSALLQASRRTRPDIRAGVWVATLSRRGDSLVTALGRPIDADAGPDAEAVIRIDDSFSAWWGTVPSDTLAEWVARRIATLLPLIDRPSAVGAPARAIQLDYDAPVFRLADYARLVAHLRASRDGVLRQRPFWVTSLVAHLSDPGYGARFRPWVDGHIVQLFETGERHDARAERQLLERLERAGLPFRLGLASFERRLATGPTTHRAWFDVIPTASRSTWYRGLWIFPAGASYLQYLHR